MTELLTPTQEDHGRTQAQAQAHEIVRLVSALLCDYDRLQEMTAEHFDLIETLADQEIPELKEEARENLRNWEKENLEEIAELRESANGYTSEDEARDAIQNHPLSIETRTGWISTGETPHMEEFRIVLCTGGPHVEIRGELDQYQMPRRAWINYQDWGTPLTQFFDIEQSTLLTYCSNFYFGE
jgi:hypothetical protein